jgi:ATP-dependent RNA helicase DeaD
LGLSDVSLEAVRHAGYEQPTPVQVGVIPPALEGKDVLGQARTGTGKTAAFVLPILERLQQELKKPQALIVVPTRELAVQVEGEVRKLAHGHDVRCVTAYGGQPIRKQLDKLKNGAQVVVGTPGRILDHLARRSFDPSSLHVVVLDEADRMLDIGFRPDIERILRRCPQSRQTLLLSATLPKPILRLAQKYMQEPITLDFSENDIAVETIDQYYFTVHPKKKFELLQRLLEREQPQQAIIFCRTKHGTEKNYQRLKKKMKDVGVMHGDMAQSARNRTMAQFREAKIRILVATDVVGRGIDVTNVSHIINYDVPQYSDDYVHRVGRTGRMGREGVAFTFVTLEEGGELTKIEMRIDRLLKKGEIEGFDPLEIVERPKPGAAPEEPQEPPPKPLYGRGGRGPKRYRRAP